ncbi:MAG: hypothetical protein JW829_01935, partial [Pirellulales bacterium]|nr:hypothetical protein [Pirellulales bacterium]
IPTPSLEDISTTKPDCTTTAVCAIRPDIDNQRFYIALIMVISFALSIFIVNIVRSKFFSIQAGSNRCILLRRRR